MVRRIFKYLLAVTVFSGWGSLAALSADAEFADFPDVPQMDRLDNAFREAGFYVGARGGVVLANDSEFTITGPDLVENAYEMGYGGYGFIGFELPDLYWGAGLRLEGEVGLIHLDVETHTVGGTERSEDDSFGSTEAIAGFLNAYVDFGNGGLRPFIGGGVGVARVTFDDHGVTGALGVMDDAGNAFAWQIMAGASVHLTDAVSLEGMVRHQSVMDVELVSSTGPTSDIDLSSTQVLFGARYHF
ncbi:MAG: outer membrane beta-barrel protein [Pseudomonadota bacterium]